MVLLALVDADYKFIYIDIGCNGRISDGGVEWNTTLSSVLENSSLNIPKERKVDDFMALPYVIVGDMLFQWSLFSWNPTPKGIYQ